MIKRLTITLLLFISTDIWVIAQSDSLNRVMYSSDFHFKDGVYINFDEWKNNRPHIKDFTEVKTNTFGAQEAIELHYSCRDTTTTTKSCIVKSCFGYVRDGIFYISQGYYGYYFRVFIIGELTHFLAFTTYNDLNTYLFLEPNSFGGTENDFREYLLDFNTGKTFQFTYSNFSAFLKARDAELYQQLIKSKKKKQMIHHFLLEYNKKHPIYLPAD